MYSHPRNPYFIKIVIYSPNLRRKQNIEVQHGNHLGRHTFATTLTLSQGVPIETVSRMLGHTNIHTTQIYAKITNEKISRDMADLTAKIGDKYHMSDDRPQSDFRNIKPVSDNRTTML